MLILFGIMMIMLVFAAGLCVEVIVSVGGSVSGAVASLVCGSAAGLCAKVIVYPLDLVKKRLQISGFAAGRPASFGETHSHASMTQCIRRVVVDEGVAGMYKGLSPSAVKAAVTAACHFFVYEQTCAALTRYHRART